VESRLCHTREQRHALAKELLSNTDKRLPDMHMLLHFRCLTWHRSFLPLPASFPSSPVGLRSCVRTENSCDAFEPHDIFQPGRVSRMVRNCSSRIHSPREWKSRCFVRARGAANVCCDVFITAKAANGSTSGELDWRTLVSMKWAWGRSGIGQN